MIYDNTLQGGQNMNALHSVSVAKVAELLDLKNITKDICCEKKQECKRNIPTSIELNNSEISNKEQKKQCSKLFSEKDSLGNNTGLICNCFISI